MTGYAIEIHDLHRSFGAVRAVEGLSLTIGKGESVAVLGPNGAGKSTTIAMLLGLLAPDAGSVAVWGMPPGEAVAGGHIAAMLQEGGLMPGVKVAELVGFVRGLYPDPLPLVQVLETAGLTALPGATSTSCPAARRSGCGSPWLSGRFGRSKPSPASRPSRYGRR